jgi:HPt (histidine-containing phosphotransfer) domain-containing protein
MSELPLLDQAALGELVAQIGDQPARAVIDLFRAEIYSFVATIGEGGAHPDDPVHRDQAGRAAHSLKSSAGQIGALALAAAAERVEAVTAESGADFVEESAALARCAEETEAALAAWLLR